MNSEMMFGTMIDRPMISEMMRPPGAFMSGIGAMGVGLFILEHLIYGAIVGGMYGTVVHPGPQPIAV